MADLDHDEFARRNQAEQALLKMGKDIELQLRGVVAKPGPSLEARRRIERILNRLEGVLASPERLREVRAVHALERARAIQVLKELARGAPNDTLTNAAAQALERLS